MSHLFCAFTERTQWKHQYDTYFGKIHWVVHEIFICFIVSLFLVTTEAAILDGQFVKKSDINLKQLRLQMILTKQDYILFSISREIGI